MDIKVRSLERYLGIGLVEFRLREAQADRSDSPTTSQPSGFQPQVLTSADSLEEKEWNANTTAGIILTGATLLEIIRFIQSSLFHSLLVMLVRKYT